jgi:class 3 adenylate cyclase
MQGRRAFLDGRPDDGRRLLERAIELGKRFGSANLVAMSLSWLGISLCEIGRGEEAVPYLEEACAAAIGGELGPWATSFVYCNTIDAYRESGEFAMAGEWNQTATRWCQRESISGIPGICRVHRAEFMRLRGAWADAEREARVAGQELDGFLPATAGEAYYQVGEVRLRIGDMDGADQAFKQAHARGRDPQPGAAMLLVLQGQPEAALRSLETSLTAHDLGFIDEMRCLLAQTDIACRLGQLDVAARASDRAEQLAGGQRGLGLQVLGAQARGTVQLARGDPEAHRTLRRTLRLWREMNAPYEAALVRLLVARALDVSGDEAGAIREVEAALIAFERLGAAPDAARSKRLLEERLAAPLAHPVAERTFLFSDIVGSTQLVDAIGDQAWTELVAWLDGSLRQCFVEHGGEEVDHAGDGFFVAFPDSQSALDCAVTIQRKLASHRREHGFAPRIRIGVHATNARHLGGRYRGRGVHEASRIASLAGPDEILASRESLPVGFQGPESQVVRVKGISKPLEVVKIVW